MRKWDEMAKLNICNVEDGALDTEFNSTPKGCLWQDQTKFLKLANEAFKCDFGSEEGFTFCASPPFNMLSTEKSKEIVAAAKKPLSGSRRRRDSFKKRLLQRLDVFKASGTETNLLGSQLWRLHQLQNGVWGGDEHRDIWCAPTPNFGLDRQRSQRNLGSNSIQSAEGGRIWFHLLVDGIRFLAIVENNTKICIDSLY